MIPTEVDQTDAEYVAEGSVLPATKGLHFGSMAEVEDWLRSVIDSAWLRSRYPRTGDIKLHDGRGSRYPRCWRRDDGWHIALPHGYRYQLIILHELSHALEPGNHGREFCAGFLSLVGRFLGRAARDDLQLEFVLARVKHRRRRELVWWRWDPLGASLW